MKLFRITTLQPNPKSTSETQKTCSEFVVADNIQQVIDYLNIDLKDEAIEVIGITEEVPVTKILTIRSDLKK